MRVVREIGEAPAELLLHTLLDLAIGWLASRPHVSSVIAGVTSVDQLQRNVAAGAWTPSPAELERIDQITALPAESGGPPRR